MSEIPKIAVLLPCKNEAGAIQKVIKDIRTIAPEYEIYVCDNMSTDNTGDMAKAMDVPVIYEPKKGKGYAMMALLNAVQADCYIICDGDNTYDVSNIKNMANMILNGYDLITGNRLSSNYYTDTNLKSHHIGNRLVNYLVKHLYGSGVADILSGYRAMSNNFVRSLPPFKGGFTIETELSIYAIQNHFKMANIPVVVQNRTYGKSKIKLKDGIQILWYIISTKKRVASHAKLK